MDNSLISMNAEKNFAYHEVLTDSDNAVKDIARLLALGVESEEIIDDSNIVVKPAVPIVDRCWEVVYPKEDRTKFPNIADWDNLLPEEYKEVTDYKISQIKDTVILKTRTIPKDIKVNNSTAMGVNQDLNKDSIEMYLEVYMPPYLCDSESADPIKQRDGFEPKVNDVNGMTATTMNTRTARNYHHLFMRIFDNINAAGDGPAENVIDAVTRDVIKWNSRSSAWSKLSWYTDFEDKFRAPLIAQPQLGMQLGTVRLPVMAGLTSESKIKIWANINASRVVLGVMGSPNVDFGDNRYLIGCAYIGQIDSFDFSLNDTAGNFGLFCTSSTSPAMGKTDIKIRPSKPAIVSGTTVTPGAGGTGSGTALPFKSGLSLFNPGTTYDLMAMELSSIPYDYTQPNGGVYWGDRYIDKATVSLNVWFDNAPGIIEYTNASGALVSKTIGISPSVTITPTVEVDPLDRKKVKISLTLENLLKALIGPAETALALAGTGIKFRWYYSYYGRWDIANLNMTYNFSYYTEYSVQTGGVKRDRFGNPVAAILDTTYGKNTANGITDFAMYATFTKDYFQRHFFMFASTEEYMQKELYGKSSYTGEYFADRIKVVHSSEGPRGILSGMITIDTSSLYPFDELIVNKDFEKYKDKPEELYIYLPVTAPYCPFANSPNGRHGIGILKDIKYPVPVTDEQIVDFAIAELQRKYADLGYVVADFALLDTSQYGATIDWTSTDSTLIEIVAATTPTTASITSVSVAPTTATVANGATKQLTATVTVTGGAAQTVTWTSSDATNKVTVDATGLVTVDAAAASGTYTITATSTVDTSKSGTATITV
jgi:hypothetical protein